MAQNTPLNADKQITCAVCAYRESPYLEACILSLLHQNVRPHIFISTSTPNDFIKGLAAKYNLPLFINTGKGDMKDNWNFAFHQAQTPYVTICHQDDIYCPAYVEELLKKIQQDTQNEIILLHTRWKMLKNGKEAENICSVLHRLLNTVVQFFPSCRWMRVRMLSLGNAIKTPSICYNKTNCPDPLFTNAYRFALDWQNSLELARKKGKFIYISAPVFRYRVSDEALSSVFIKNNAREEEELAIYQSCWPKCIAKMLAKLYKRTYTIYE